MQSFRDISAAQNGISNSLLHSIQSEPTLNANYGKFNGIRPNMAIGSDLYGNHYPNTPHASQTFHMHHAVQHHLQHNQSATVGLGHNGSSLPVPVWDVWTQDFHEGMQLVRRLARSSRFVAIDTEFPGVVAKVFGDYANSFEQAYHNIKVNIDMLRPIQIGFSFFGERGESVDVVSTVQFNLKWNVENETHAADSIQLLESCGIDFEKLKRNGVELIEFAAAFLESGLALNDNITWIGFHSAYDFAYMMKICTDWPKLPANFLDFQKHLVMYFPRIVDLKAMVSERKFPKGGLQELADALHVPRIGLQHQAGSDAMLTGETFFRFLEEHSGGELEPRIVNLVYGLNYCPNGINNTFMHMNASSPQLLSQKYMLDSSDAYQRNKPRSADHSGRSSPNGSVSGHKSS